MILAPSFQEAVTFHQSGQLEKAVEAYRQVLQSNLKDAQVYTYLSGCLLQLNRVSEALAVGEEGVTEHPQNVELLSFLGMLYWDLKQVDKAISLTERALECAPDSPEMYTNLGNLYYQSGNQNKALEIYQRAIERFPDHSIFRTSLGIVYSDLQMIPEAVEVLKKAIQMTPNDIIANKQLGMIYHYSGSIEEAEVYFVKCLDLVESVPEKVELLVLLGNTQRDQSQVKKAKEYYEKALELDPNQPIAKENLQKMTQYSISQWHFDMLADIERNNAYDQALKNKVKPGMQVLDIGAGSGLLSLMAARAGASNVCALEMVEVLADTANKVVTDNNYSEIISVHNVKSTSVEIGKEMPEKADLVVSEILDVGLLGEGVIPSLRHAWKNLLKPDAVCIPKSATVMAQLIESEELSRVFPITEINGFDLSAFDHFLEKDMYLGKTLNQVDYTSLNAPVEVSDINFYQLPPQATNEAPNVSTIEIPIQKSGTIHGIAFWFNLHLDETIVVSSGPKGELKHWGQAVFMFENPKQAEVGETIELSVLQSETTFRFRIK